MDDAEALERADRIIGWMAQHIGRMAPPDGGLADLNEHWLHMERKARRQLPRESGAPLDQRIITTDEMMDCYQFGKVG